MSTQNKISSSIKFLDKELELSEKDRKDPVVLMFLSQIEIMELKYGDGLLWYNHLKENYGVQFGDINVETKLQNLLISNQKRG